MIRTMSWTVMCDGPDCRAFVSGEGQHALSVFEETQGWLFIRTRGQDAQFRNYCPSCRKALEASNPLLRMGT